MWKEEHSVQREHGLEEKQEGQRAGAEGTGESGGRWHPRGGRVSHAGLVAFTLRDIGDHWRVLSRGVM